MSTTNDVKPPPAAGVLADTFSQCPRQGLKHMYSRGMKMGWNPSVCTALLTLTDTHNTMRHTRHMDNGPDLQFSPRVLYRRERAWGVWSADMQDNACNHRLCHRGMHTNIYPAYSLFTLIKLSRIFFEWTGCTCEHQSTWMLWVRFLWFDRVGHTCIYCGYDFLLLYHISYISSALSPPCGLQKSVLTLYIPQKCNSKVSWQLNQYTYSIYSFLFSSVTRMSAPPGFNSCCSTLPSTSKSAQKNISRPHSSILLSLQQEIYMKFLTVQSTNHPKIALWVLLLSIPFFLPSRQTFTLKYNLVLDWLDRIYHPINMVSAIWDTQSCPLFTHICTFQVISR